MRILEEGTKVKVNQGFGVHTLGIVQSFNPGNKQLGVSSKYLIEVTGGKNCFGKPAKAGELHAVNAAHVSKLHLSIVR